MQKGGRKGAIEEAVVEKAPKRVDNLAAEIDRGTLCNGSWNVRKKVMSRVCQVTGKRPQSGNNVSHANNKTRRRFLPNIQQHRFWLESEKRFVKLKVSTKGMRIIDKLGIEQVVTDLRAQGQRV